MKVRSLIFSIFMFICQCSIAQNNLQIQPVLDGMLIDFPNVRDFTISKDLQEAYFSAQSTLGEVSVIMKVSKKGKKWADPEVAVFSGQDQDMEPFLSPDNLRLYFVSNRSKSDTTASKDFDIWFVERASPNDQWSTPENMGIPINSSQNEFYPSVAESGNLYFTSDRPGSKGRDDIFMSQWTDKGYTEPVSLSDSINSGEFEFNACIASDESFIVFTGYNWEGGFGSGDLYISYKTGDGWSKATNLGDKINSPHMDYCPYFHEESNTFYFTSRKSTIEKGFSSTKELLKEITKYENGQSRIYHLKDFMWIRK